MQNLTVVNLLNLDCVNIHVCQCVKIQILFFQQLYYIHFLNLIMSATTLTISTSYRAPSQTKGNQMCTTLLLALKSERNGLVTHFVTADRVCEITRVAVL